MLPLKSEAGKSLADVFVQQGQAFGAPDYPLTHFAMAACGCLWLGYD